MIMATDKDWVKIYKHLEAAERKCEDRSTLELIEAIRVHALCILCMAGELSSLSCLGAGHPGSAWWSYSFCLRCPICVSRFLWVRLATLVEMAGEGCPAMRSRHIDCL